MLGPEAPLITLGGGLASLAVQAKRDMPESAVAVVAASGGFAATTTLLGSPILGAFLLMEASGLGRPILGLVLVPGLLAAGVGSLIFIGLDAWTGFGTMTSVLLATLLLLSDGLAVMPLVIVAVVVAYVASARLIPTAKPAAERATPAAAQP